MRGILAFAQQVGEVGWSPAARTLWAETYPALTADIPGLVGKLLARGAAHLLRLSALLLLAGLAAARADAGTTKIGVALDTDSNAATGCALATADGTVPGIEQIATTVITSGANGAVVTRLERHLCAGGGFGAQAAAHE